MIEVILKAQATTQIAIMKANSREQLAASEKANKNLIAFHTVSAQALAAKGGDKESKLTPAKKRILQACAGHGDEVSFVAEEVY